MGYMLDDSWDNCGPVARAGNACFGFYARCGIWVARNLTDGFVPGEIAAGYGSPEQARKLVDVGLWEAVDGGYFAPDYLSLNPTAEMVQARKKADAERKARWRARRTRDKTRDSAGSHGGTDGVTPRSPAPPKGGRARDEQRPLPPWCGRCNKSTRMDAADDGRSIPCGACHPSRTNRTNNAGRVSLPYRREEDPWTG